METPPAHSHLHGSGAGITPSRRSVVMLAAITGVLLLATIAGMIALWPSSGDSPPKTEFLAPGVEILEVTVTSEPGATDPSQEAVPVLITATGESPEIAGEEVQVEITPEVAGGVQVGDRLEVLSFPEEGSGSGEAAPYYYFDHERSLPLGVLFVVYLLLVALVARGAGLRAVVGLAAGVAIVVWFLLPAILAGENAVLAALVAGAAMIFPSVYFAHGVSVRTTTAVLGTIGGVVVTVGVALLAGRPAGMTGSHDEAAKLLLSGDPTLALPAIFLAGVIISGLGALNDVTITQASAAWELRAAMPAASRFHVFSSTMRIGRDHIASTVYTLAYAYIGSALPTLLFASTMDRSLTATLGAGEIAAEVFRTLIASMGLVLAIPLTTAIAAWLAVGAPRGSSRTDEEPAHHGRRARRVSAEDRLAGETWG